MKKLVILSGLIALVGLTPPVSLTLAASKSHRPSVSGPAKVTIKPPTSMTAVKPPGKGGVKAVAKRVGPWTCPPGGTCHCRRGPAACAPACGGKMVCGPTSCSCPTMPRTTGR